jgi:hypothetical protein
MDDVNRGLYNKYTVTRNSDFMGKHDDCIYFVLDLNCDPFAIPAIKAYIESCKDTYPVLAQDLYQLLHQIGVYKRILKNFEGPDNENK